MDISTLELPSLNTTMLSSAAADRRAGAGVSSSELAFEEGLWLSAIRTFTANGAMSFVDADTQRKDPARDWAGECRLTHAALLITAELNFRLRRSIGEAGKPNEHEISFKEIGTFGRYLHDAIIITEKVIESAPVRFPEWKAFAGLLHTRFSENTTVQKLTDYSQRLAEESVPEKLRALLAEKSISASDSSDLELVLPRFAAITKGLSIVGRMLRNDEPLKPAILLFSDICRRAGEMILYINYRLGRFPNEEAELFSSLDGASYTASLELKKVCNQELSGLIGVKPAPWVYARIETAYALLNDSFEQIMAGFARLADGKTTPAAIYPNFEEKRQSSSRLRSELWKLMHVVRDCEREPNKGAVENVKREFAAFVAEVMHFLYYKDKETVERFGEEIIAAESNNDLVPILHRCGAYLETLFSQVNMRTVLAAEPFKPSAEN